jgi:hypothetical protein
VITAPHTALVVAAAVVLPVLATAGTAHAWCQMTSANVSPTPGDPCPTEGVPLQWEEPCISYAIDGRGSADLPLEVVREEAALSFEAWTLAECPDGERSDMQVRQLDATALCNEAEFNQSGGNVNVLAFVPDWTERELPRTAFALTTVWHDTRTGEILDVDTLVNEELGPYAVCPPGGCDAPGASRPPVDLRNVLTHEAGHFFGLAHTEIPLESLEIDEWPTMAPSANPGDTFMRTLVQDDVDGFCSVYPPGSMTAACDFDPIGGLDLDCESGSDGGGGRCSILGPPGPTGTPGMAGVAFLSWLALSLLRARRAR